MQIDRRSAAAHNNLGNALDALGQVEEAIGAYRAALRLQPGEADFHYNLGNALRTQRRLDEAIQAYHEALRADPAHVRASHNLANAYREKGQLNDCIAASRATIRLSADHSGAYHTLGHALRLSGRLDEAITALRRAAELARENSEIWNKLSIALAERGFLDESVSAGLEALRLEPKSAGALNNLGNRYKDQGRLDQAIETFRRALELDPESAIAHSNLIFALHLHPGFDAYRLLAEAREWDRRHAQPLRQLAQPHLNGRSSERPLRLGYVSGDFREHVAGRSIMPLLRQHDREHFEVFCYSNVLRPDAFTEQLRSLPVTWRDISLLDDAAAAQMIRADHIDLLIDLSAHSAGNRLLVFARKPAPVQVTYLGYPGTTGLGTMDYRLSDPFLDPPGGDLDCYSEQTVRLPHSYWCYQPAGNVPDAAQALPASGASITFGCLNNFAKVSTEALELWAEILGAIPGSRLLLHAPEGSCRERVRACLGQRAIASGLASLSSAGRHGRNMCKIFGASILRSTLFLTAAASRPATRFGWVFQWLLYPEKRRSAAAGEASSPTSACRNWSRRHLLQYVEIAVSLAGNLTRLRDLRTSLRTRMKQSPVCDSAAYTREIEDLWRELWRRWRSR